MTTIKALEGRTVHQIQSGQVIVDLCSVVKELVENSLDAGATAIDVRFKGNGLETIEVQDNGVGISSENYQTVGKSLALKHCTSKLASYDDLTSLQTFGFRGEALSSLCALSDFHIVTVRAEDAPKGARLDFETSGTLKATQVVASQKGTTVAVENLFANLPVRRRELEKNIKREYGKVLTTLQAYACISTQVKFSASNVMAKGKKATVFATKWNNTTRENIANVFGAKVLPGLVTMDLSFDMQQSRKPSIQGWTTQAELEDRRVRIVGHVSRPVFGEGRQTPDRQMFFVNSRPCGLPQVAKVFNEIYKTFNLSQSPFVFANIMLDTNAYDVNVSPDKRTILLHDQGMLLDNLRKSLLELFEKQDQTVPQTQPPLQKLPSYKKLTVRPETSTAGSAPDEGDTDENDEKTNRNEARSAYLQSSIATNADGRQRPNLIGGFAERDTIERVQRSAPVVANVQNGNGVLSKDKQKLLRKLSKEDSRKGQPKDYDVVRDVAETDALMKGQSIPVLDFNKRIAEQQVPPNDEEVGSHALSGHKSDKSEEEIPTVISTIAKPSRGIVQNAFDRMRPKRHAVEVAEVTIGDTITTMALGPPVSKRLKFVNSPLPTHVPKLPAMQRFSNSMQSFAAPGTELGTPKVDQIRNLSGQSTDDEDAQYRVTPQFEDEDVEMTSKQSAESSTPEADHDRDSSHPKSVADSQESDEEYLDEEDGKAREDARVAALIQQAEEAAAMPSHDNAKRAYNILKGGDQKDSTTHLTQIIEQSIDRINVQLQNLEASLEPSRNTVSQPELPVSLEAPSPEEHLSLTVSKEDFSRMDIIGQFNRGFILAVRPSHSSTFSDEVFIIDQHASDEKSNFERLQSTTIVQNQRLVHPHRLDLTAIEEEIILENNPALLKNGFLVDTDTSGDSPVGQRCKLISLPMSREVTFDIGDLEELIHLLAESAPLADATVENIPRPSKVRKMFAMRACRSSVMIGKSMSLRQMEKLVRRMGEIDKPWNCPHGRPTMRHVLGLADWEDWRERSGFSELRTAEGADAVDWGDWMRRMQGVGESKNQEGCNKGIEGEPEGTDDACIEEEEEEEEEGEGEDVEEEAEDEEVEDEDQATEDEVHQGLRVDLHSRFAHDD